MFRGKRENTHDPDSCYEMTISLSVLDDLGIRLYSNIPAVLSEVVANAWDADATEVTIDIKDGHIVITDNGHGMTPDDINRKYLTVGYRKREHGELETPSGRPVMGRKGIGKLSIFSIAHSLKIHTVHNGTRSALSMNSKDIRRVIENSPGASYKPRDLGSDVVEITRGTRLLLTDLKRMPTIATDVYLRRRIARRFTVLDGAHDFSVKLNDEEVSAQDRDYYSLIQFMWHFGYDGETPASQCPDLNQEFHWETSVVECGDETYRIRGWIGTVHESGKLDEHTNTIVVFANGKLAHEDLLADMNETGVYANFVIGEIDADFLDKNDEEDIITSARQRVQQHAERYVALKTFTHRLLKRIQTRWTPLRNEEGAERMIRRPAVKKWYDRWTGDNRAIARKMLGQIDGLGLPDAASTRAMVKASMLAFEKMAMEHQLSELDHVESPEQLEMLIAAFGSIAELEKAHYYQIAQGRMRVIQKFEKLTDENHKEKVIQEHLFEHLWLLDPSWEMATGASRMEERVTTEFREMEDRLTDEERQGRIDIRYRNITGTHVIVELKRYSVTVSAYDLVEQIGKYRSALDKCLTERFPNETAPGSPIRCICVVGKTPPQGYDVTQKLLAVHNGKFVTYDELIEGARQSYQEYLDRQREISRLQQIINSVDDDFTD